MLPEGIPALQRHPELTADTNIPLELHSAPPAILHTCYCSEALRRPLLARISVQQQSQRQGAEQDVQVDIEAGSQEEGGADNGNEQVPAQGLLTRFSIRYAATYSAPPAVSR